MRRGVAGAVSQVVLESTAIQGKRKGAMLAGVVLRTVRAGCVVYLTTILTPFGAVVVELESRCGACAAILLASVIVCAVSVGENAMINGSAWCWKMK